MGNIIEKLQKLSSKEPSKFVLKQIGEKLINIG